MARNSFKRGWKMRNRYPNRHLNSKRWIQKAKHNIYQLEKLVTHMEIILNCYVLVIIQYQSYWRMLGIPWIERVGNEEVLRKIENIRDFYPESEKNVSTYCTHNEGGEFWEFDKHKTYPKPFDAVEHLY